jgi:hypothetical protein
VVQNIDKPWDWAGVSIEERQVARTNALNPTPRALAVQTEEPGGGCHASV